MSVPSPKRGVCSVRGMENFLSLGCYLCYVLFNLANELLTYRYVVANAELVIYCLPWHCLLLLDEGKNLVAFACKFELGNHVAWLKEGTEHTLLCGT